MDQEPREGNLHMSAEKKGPQFLTLNFNVNFYEKLILHKKV